MHSFIPFSLLFLVDLKLSEAARIPFDVRFTSYSSLGRRATNATFPITNTFNAEYISNVTLGGRSIPVLLDTGSSDLWVTGEVPGTQDTGKSDKLSYAVGTAAGDINTANLTFGGYDVPNQAYSSSTPLVPKLAYLPCSSESNRYINILNKHRHCRFRWSHRLGTKHRIQDSRQA